MKKEPAAAHISDHIPSYDRIRVLATVCAVVTHTIQNDLDQFPSRSVPAASAAWVLAMVCNILFVALSGALLYGWKEESLLTFYKKRLIRVVLPLWIYDLLVLAARAVLLPDSSPVTFTGAIVHLLTGQIPEAPQSWLIYLILSLYITVPFFRWLFKDLPWKMLTALIFLCLAFLTLQYIVSAAGQSLALQIYIPGWLFVSFLGYWLAHPRSRRYAVPVIAAGLAAGAVIAFLCIYNPDQAWLSEKLCNDTPLMILWGAGLFMLLQKSSRPEGIRRESRLLHLLSRHSYGIILLHWAVMQYFLKTVFQMHAYDHGWIAGTILCSCVNLGISLIISLVLDTLIIHPLQKLLTRL